MREAGKDVMCREVMPVLDLQVQLSFPKSRLVSFPRARAPYEVST